VPRTAGPLTDADAQMALLHGLRSVHFGGEVVLSVDSSRFSEALQDRGATLLLEPFHDAAEYAVERIEAALKSRDAA
jgi:hypothetical protein